MSTEQLSVNQNHRIPMDKVPSNGFIPLGKIGRVGVLPDNRAKDRSIQRNKEIFNKSLSMVKGGDVGAFRISAEASKKAKTQNLRRTIKRTVSENPEFETEYRVLSAEKKKAVDIYFANEYIAYIKEERAQQGLRGWLLQNNKIPESCINVDGTFNIEAISKLSYFREHPDAIQRAQLSTAQLSEKSKFRKAVEERRAIEQKRYTSNSARLHGLLDITSDSIQADHLEHDHSTHKDEQAKRHVHSVECSHGHTKEEENGYHHHHHDRIRDPITEAIERTAERVVETVEKTIYRIGDKVTNGNFSKNPHPSVKKAINGFMIGMRLIPSPILCPGDDILPIAVQLAQSVFSNKNHVTVVAPDPKFRSDSIVVNNPNTHNNNDNHHTPDNNTDEHPVGALPRRVRISFSERAKGEPLLEFYEVPGSEDQFPTENTSGNVIEEVKADFKPIKQLVNKTIKTPWFKRMIRLTAAMSTGVIMMSSSIGLVHRSERSEVPPAQGQSISSGENISPMPNETIVISQLGKEYEPGENPWDRAYKKIGNPVGASVLTELTLAQNPGQDPYRIMPGQQLTELTREAEETGLQFFQSRLNERFNDAIGSLLDEANTPNRDPKAQQIVIGVIYNALQQKALDNGRIAQMHGVTR